MFHNVFIALTNQTRGKRYDKQQEGCQTQTRVCETYISKGKCRILAHTAPTALHLVGRWVVEEYERRNASPLLSLSLSRYIYIYIWERPKYTGWGFKLKRGVSALGPPGGVFSRLGPIGAIYNPL